MPQSESFSARQGRAILNPCDCEDWKAAMPQIEMAQSMAWIHGDRYTAKQFIYCPWCGKKREE